MLITPYSVTTMPSLVSEDSANTSLACCRSTSSVLYFEL